MHGAVIDPRGAAFFDLDRTLIAENSGILYAHWERRHRRISRLQLAQGLLWGGLYHLSLVDIDKAFRSALAHYVGTSDAELDQRTRAWFASEIRHRLLPSARDAISRHRDGGQKTVLLTNSSCYAARVACADWQLDDWLANIFTLDDAGRLDGGVESPLCYGHGKVVRAERWAQAAGVDLAHSWFYTDSLSDLPMLERVGHPVVVQPDPRLRREARRRGWPIVDWSPRSSRSSVSAAGVGPA